MVLDGLKPIHTFDSGRLVHPKMVWELMPWISDDEEQMLVLSVSDTERSNRYFEPVEKLIFDDGREFVHYTCRLGKHLRFGYIYHGRSDSGIHVLETIESSRGSGTFVSLFLCRLENRKKYGIKDGRLAEAGNRQVLEMINVLPLGDRWMGRVELIGNRLKMGRDEGRFGDPRDEGFVLILAP